MKLAVALVVAGGLTYRTGSTMVGAVAGVLAYLLTSWRLVRDELRHRGHRWWAEPNLVRAFMDAGILPALKKDQRPHVLRRLGQPQVTDAGVSVIVELPPGIPWTTVQAKHAPLAAAMHKPLAKLLVGHEPTDPAGAVRLWVGAQTQPLQARHERSHLAHTDRTSWRDPVRVGRDGRGQVVEVGTNEHNTLVSGIMGFGKTTLSRLVVGHYLLDPDALVYGLDGKGSRRDYALVAGLARCWVWGTDEDAPAATLAMFTDLLAMVRDRNRHSETQPDPAGVLLILEEYQDVRAAADRKQQEALDTTLGRIVRMGRAVGFHVLISTQRPSVDDFPAGQRNLIDQRATLKTRNGQDAALVLGHTPELPLPTRRGDAIVALPDQDHSVVVDYLDADDWRDLCGRAAGLRQPINLPARSIGSDEPPADPLLTAVADILGDGGASATDILTRLPAELRPATAATLGLALKKYPQLTPALTHGGREWRLVSPAGVKSGTPPVAQRERYGSI